MTDNLKEAMSTYVTRQIGYVCQVDDFEENEVTLCDSGCWVEYRVIMWYRRVGDSRAMNYYEYEGELADFIDELTKED